MTQSPPRVMEVLGPVLPRRRLALLGLLALLGSLSEGLGLMLLVPLIDLAMGSKSTGIASAFAALGLPPRLDFLLALFVVLVACRAALVQWRIVLETRVRLEVSDGLRTRLLRALLNAEWRFLSSARQGDLLALTTNFVERAGTGLQYLLGLFSALATLAAMLGAALLIAPAPALATGCGGVIVLLLYSGLRRRAAREGDALSHGYKEFYGFFVERFDALRVIKSLGKAESETNRAQTMAGDLAEAQVRYQAHLALGQVVLQVGAAAVMVIAVWLALTRWHTAIAALLPLMALFARSVPLLAAVQTSWQQYAYSAPAIGEVGAMIAAASSRAEPLPDKTLAAPALTRELKLDAVTIRHAGRDSPALDAVSLTMPAGSVCFVTGPSGAGKSTLADLLAGLTRPDSGQLLIDGTPLAAGSLGAWRERVAYVQQEPILFDASLRENLLWAGPEADAATLAAALKRASADFVFGLPQGLDTRVGSSGRQLSGGERQRIVLARALLRDPALLILDEATSALDAANEAAIVEAVKALRGTITLVIIGHGGKLAELADQSIRLENGQRLG